MKKRKIHFLPSKNHNQQIHQTQNDWQKTDKHVCQSSTHKHTNTSTLLFCLLSSLFFWVQLKLALQTETCRMFATAAAVDVVIEKVQRNKKIFFFFWTAVQILFSFSFTQTSHFFLTHIRSNENNLPAPVFESTTTEPVREGVCKCKCKRHKSHQLCLVGVVSVVPPLPAREGRPLPLPLRDPGIANRRREKQTDSVSGGQCSPSLVFLTTTLLLLHLAIDKFNCAENSTCTPNTHTHTLNTLLCTAWTRETGSVVAVAAGNSLKVTSAAAKINLRLLHIVVHKFQLKPLRTAAAKHDKANRIAAMKRQSQRRMTD